MPWHYLPLIHCRVKLLRRGVLLTEAVVLTQLLLLDKVRVVSLSNAQDLGLSWISTTSPVQQTQLSSRVHAITTLVERSVRDHELLHGVRGFQIWLTLPVFVVVLTSDEVLERLALVETWLQRVGGFGRLGGRLFAWRV